MKLLKYILVIALGIFAVKSDAQVADSSSYYLTYPKKKYLPDIYCKASVNEFFPVGDFYKIGSTGLLGISPGFNFYFDKIRAGITVNADFTALGSNQNRVYSFFRSRFDELENFSNSNQDAKSGAIIFRANAGLYFNKPLTKKLAIEFYLMAGQTNALMRLFGRYNIIDGNFYSNDNGGKSINLSIEPKFNNVSYNFSLRILREIRHKLSVGLNLNYIYEISSVLIKETKIANSLSQRSESTYPDRLNFSYFQVGICAKIPMFREHS